MGIVAHPVPVEIEFIATQQPDGSRWVIVKINTPNTSNMYWLTTDDCKQFAVNIKNAGRQAETGLIVPAGGNPLFPASGPMSPYQEHRGNGNPNG